MKMIMLVLSSLLATQTVYAAADLADAETSTEAAPAQASGKPGVYDKDKKANLSDALAESLSQTKTHRQNMGYFALVNYSPVDMFLPSKLGATVGWNFDVSKTYELEYLHSGISASRFFVDFGAMSDDRISVIARSYASRNSFHVSYGLSYFDFSLHVGDQLLSRLTSGSYPSIDLLQIQSLGFNLGLGNRWTFQHDITFGIDWISWAQPLYTLKRRAGFLDVASNSQDRDDFDNAMKLISYLPRFSFLKFQLGVLF